MKNKISKITVITIITVGVGNRGLPSTTSEYKNV